MPIDPIPFQYGEDMPEALPGMKADSTRDDDCPTCVNAEATAEIPFGVCVMLGTNSTEDCVLPTGGTPRLGGIVNRDGAFLPGVHLGDTGIKPKVPFNRFRTGRVWAVCEEAMNPGDTVFVRTTAGVGEQLGALRNDADGGDAISTTLIKVVASTTGGLVKVQCNFPE